MPQKAIFSRMPLVDVYQCPVSHGQVRTEEPWVRQCYKGIQPFLEAPETWEGAFGLACLLCEAPMEEPVSKRILAAGDLEGEGGLEGNWRNQLCTARAMLAVYEYTVDKQLLQRLISWCNAAEVHWDEIAADWDLRVRPADWMDFWIRLYRITGVRAILRLCTHLRSAAMDWATVLQSIHQRQPLSRGNTLAQLQSYMQGEERDETAYFTRLWLTNQAELLADGMRYAVCAGLFSGNGQELKAAEKGWQSISRDHGAVCGGTTADALLAGREPDKGMDTAALAAWTEAFCAAAQPAEAPWAMEQLTRLAFNALPACLTENGLLSYSRVNSALADPGTADCFAPMGAEKVYLWARLSRAAVAVWKTAVTQTAKGLSLNVPVYGVWTTGVRQKPVLVKIGKNSLSVRQKEDSAVPVRLFIPVTETRSFLLHRGEETVPFYPASDEKEETALLVSRYHMLPKQEGKEQTLLLRDDHRVYVENTGHEGVCCFACNQLLSWGPENEKGWVAAAGIAQWREDGYVLPVQQIEKPGHGFMSNIPVLPLTAGETRFVPLKPYSLCPQRITVFPRKRA